MLQNINLAKIKSRLEEAKTNAIATAERVKERVREEKEKKGGLFGSVIEKIGTAVEELAEESGFEESLNAPRPLDLVYVTKQFISMGYPCDRATLRQRLRQEYHRQRALGHGGIPQISTSLNDISAIARHLRKYHQGQYMVLNVSEEIYDYSWFEDQVLEFKFPGQPAPPLGMLFKMCASVESWLAADPSNVIAVHCLTGRGRTSVVIACAATWLGLFESTHEALEYVAKRRGETVDKLTIPSQRRYAQYFANVLDGVAPRSEPLVLRRAIMNVSPDFEPAGNQQYNPGCRPYLQFFKAGKLAYTASWTRPGDELNFSSNDDLNKNTLATPGDAPLIFNIDCVVHGDLLVRCRHKAADGSRISMFRAALHVGYAPAGVLRLTKSQLDGACADPRFPDHFVLDLIFAPLDDTTNDSASSKNEASNPSSSSVREDAARADLKTSYDALLHKDSRFWEEVRARKDRALMYREKLKARQQQAASIDSNAPTDVDTNRPDTVEVLQQNSTKVFAIDTDDSPVLQEKPSSLSEPQVHTDDLLQQLAEAEQGLHGADEDHLLLTPAAQPPHLEKEKSDISPRDTARTTEQGPDLHIAINEPGAVLSSPIEPSSLEQNVEAVPLPPDESHLEQASPDAHSDQLCTDDPLGSEALPPDKPTLPPDISLDDTNPLSSPKQELSEEQTLQPVQQEEPNLLAPNEDTPIQEADLLGFDADAPAPASAVEPDLLSFKNDVLTPARTPENSTGLSALDSGNIDAAISPLPNDGVDDEAFIDDFESYLNSLSTKPSS